MPERTERRAQVTGIAIAATIAVVAGVVLVGWITGRTALTTFGRPWTPMTVNTALSVLLVSALLVAMAVPDIVRTRSRHLRVAGAVVGAQAALMLLNTGGGALRETPLLTTPASLRMAPSSAFAFLTLGLAFVLVHRRARLAEVLAGLTFTVATSLLVAFLYGALPVSNLMGRVNMSPLTGICLVLSSAGMIAMIPGGHLAALLRGNDEGSRIARRALPLVVLGPIALGAVRLWAQHRGLLTLEYGLAIMVASTVLLGAVMVLWGAERANRAIAGQRREAEVHEFLAQASMQLNVSEDPTATLATVAGLCVPTLGDSCSITLVRDDGTLENVAVVHEDPAKVAWAKDYLRQYPARPDDPVGIAEVARTGVAQLHGDIPDEALARMARSPEQLTAIRQLGLRSMILVPLAVSGRTIGVLAIVTSESGRSLGSADLKIAQQLADRCASAVERDRLIEDLRQQLVHRHRAEAELRKLTAELERRVAQRTAELNAANRELESFSYSVSHDLRTPLRALDGFSQALLEDYADRLDDEGRDYLRRIRRGSQRMGDLIDALLDLSRVSRGELRREQVDLSGIVAELVDSLRERHPERSVDAIVEPGMHVVGDPRLLRALLQNLVTNAWKFTARTPAPRIEFGVAGQNGHRSRVHMLRDNGAGFDMTYASKLFGAFQRLHNDSDFEGTGVGLATAQRIVHRHGGEIWAEGEPGRGATFYFTLE